jgi:N-dimethylarginine dimethylaminohydrolase
MATTPRVLMCPPEHYRIDYEINPWMNRLVGTDQAQSEEQWRALHDILVDLGATIERLQAVPGLPDLVFTANAGLIYGRLFVSSRFRHCVRQGETPYFEDWAKMHGFEVVELPPGGYFEGAGDALFCGETLFAGYRFRSDARSHQWIGDRLGVQVLPLELVDPRFYHLDTCFCPLDEDAAIYYPGAFDDYGRSVLKDRVGTLIEVSADEATSFSCNAVVVGRTVVLNAETPKLSRALVEAGYSVRPTSLTEFIKAGGSAKCLTLRLDGEEAAAWRRNAAETIA